MFLHSRPHVVSSSVVALLLTAGHSAYGQTSPVRVTTPNVITTAGSTQVAVAGQSFVNGGLVGMGRIAAGTLDFNNDSIGAFSGMDLILQTWRRTATGYTGGLFGLPDRGPNGIGSVNFSNYAGRLNAYTMTFTPYTDAANLPAATSSQNQVALTQTGGLLLRDFSGNVTTGLDPGTGAASVITQNGIQLPGQTSGIAAGKISLDAEAVRFLRDGNFYVSDEYGSNVYYFNSGGRLQGVIRPPDALLPRDATGALSYSSLTDPATGRRVNQGIEGMAITPDGRKLVTLAQSATIQDSTGNQQDRTNTRLMIYDISASRTPSAPVADYVMQLPIYTLNGNGAAPNRTAAQSEVLALNDTQFLVLSRDGLGLGLTTGNSVFKSVLLVDITGATNIAGTHFETTTAPISPGGILNPAIRPVQQFELVNMLNATQLAKFGENLNNVAPNRLTLGEKWEGMALAPVLDEKAPQDFFLFVGNDNDFLSSSCRVNNEDCAQSVNSDAHMLVYRLTLPTYVDPEYRAAMVSGGPAVLSILGQSAADLAGANLDNILAHSSAVRRARWTDRGATAWLSGDYGRRRWNDQSGTGAAARSEGLRGTIGIDYGLTERVSIGATVGHGRAGAGSDSGFAATTRGNSYGATARYHDQTLFLGMAYSRGTYSVEDITRPGAYGLTAQGATDATNDSLLLSASFTFVTGLATVAPTLDYRRSRTSVDAFTESGAAGGNIAFPRYDFTTDMASAGAEAQFEWRGTTPLVHAAYNMGLQRTARSATVNLAGAEAAMASEVVTIPAANADFISAGLGLQKASATGLWYVDYTAEFGHDGRVNRAVNAGIAFTF